VTEQTESHVHLPVDDGQDVQAKKPLAVYLAGGMKSGWQDRVIAAHPEMRFLDPRSHGLTTEEEYTEWDLQAIRLSDVVLAYMDTGNPSGFGLSLEVGYANALGKRILYVCEDASPRQKYFGMVRACSDRVLASLDEAIALLGGVWLGTL
jgi:nucleoside 2-deoxyribosyltransferase